MNISITFKNIPSSDAVKSHIDKKFNKLDRMLDGPAQSQVVLSEEKLRSIAEVKFVCNKLKIHASSQSDDNNMYLAIDSLVEKVKIQISKHKDTQRKHLSGDKQSIKDTELDDTQLDAVDSE